MADRPLRALMMEDMSIRGKLGAGIGWLRAVTLGKNHAKPWRYTSELQQAYDLQSGLLPLEPPQLAGLHIACGWQASRSISGDYFDVFSLDENKMALCVADVTGKGMAAVLQMENLQRSVRALAPQAKSPADFCAMLNRALCEGAAPSQYVTLFYGFIEAKKMHLRYENAGHCLPLLVHADNTIELPASYSGVLGLFSHWTYHSAELTLRPGDCLVLMNKGVLEPENEDKEEFGYRRLIEVVQRSKESGANEVRKGILDAVSVFCRGDFQDDSSFIVVVVE